MALILAGAPEIAYWGRQVMLEIPAFALIVWSAIFVVRYLHEKRIAWLYLGIALAVLAMYVKLTSGFFLIVCAAALFETRGKALLRDRHSYIIALLAVIAIIPLLILTLKFGQTNIQSVRGSADGNVIRTSISEWIWYHGNCRTQMSWPCLAAAVAGLGLIMARRNSVSQYTILLLWFAVGYLFFSAISLKDTRFDVAVLFPVAMFAAVGMRGILARWPRTAGTGNRHAVGIITFGLTYFEPTSPICLRLPRSHRLCCEDRSRGTVSSYFPDIVTARSSFPCARTRSAGTCGPFAAISCF